MADSPSSELKLADIRKVEIHWVSGSPTSYLVHVDEIAKFVEATVRLHFNPGINPHQTDRKARKCARIWKIEVQKLVFKGPYWWSTPNLGINNVIDGARTIDGEIVGAEEAFVDHAYVDHINAEEEAMEDAWERRHD